MGELCLGNVEDSRSQNFLSGLSRKLGETVWNPITSRICARSSGAGNHSCLPVWNERHSGPAPHKDELLQLEADLGRCGEIHAPKRQLKPLMLPRYNELGQPNHFYEKACTYSRSPFVTAISFPLCDSKATQQRYTAKIVLLTHMLIALVAVVVIGMLNSALKSGADANDVQPWG